jgi:hypothetical protein
MSLLDQAPCRIWRLQVVRRFIFFLLVTWLLLGCTTAPRYRGVPIEGNADNVLGVAVDENFQVVEVEAGSAAQNAGVEAGDLLVALTWILSEAPEELPAANGAVESGSAAPLTNTTTLLRPPAGVENKTIPFTDESGIRMLTSYGVPLRLQIVRQGEVHELTIIPAPRTQPSDQPTAPSTKHF